MNIAEYARRLGIDTSEIGKANPVDIEAGKAGYQKYLADTANGKIYLPGGHDSLESYAQRVDEWHDKSFGEKINARWQNFKRILGIDNSELFYMGSSVPRDPLTRFLKGELSWEEMQAVNRGIKDQDFARPQDDWTDEERWAFGEAYAESATKAFQLADEINTRHAQAKKQKQAENIAEWTDRNLINRIIGSVGSLAINAAAGGAAYAEALGEKALLGRTYEKDYLMPHEIANTMQGTVAENLSEKSKALGYIYNIGMSVGQSTLAGVTGGSAGALVQFFGMSASNGFTDAKSRGADDNQALAFGTLSGLAEAIPEMISVDKFLGLASAAQVDNVFKSILKQAGAEALEEATTSTLTEVADRWVMGGKSQYALTVQELMASGMTEAEAKNKAFTQTLLSIAGDAVTGAISGTASGGIAVGFNKLNNKYFQRKTNAEAKEALTPEASNLIEEGKKHESSTKQAERLEKKLADGKELSGYELRMLAHKVSEATNQANVDTVRQAIIEKMKAEGVSEKDAKRLGEIALNKALGNDVSKIQDVMLRRNEAANKVYNQIDESHMESGIADSDWIEKTPLRQLRYEAKAEKEGATANTQATATGVERLKQDLMAKKIAKNYKINDASLEGKFTVSEDDKIKFKKSSEDSKIHTEEITTSLTKEDIAELTAIEKIANELGVDIHVYESKRNKDGSRTFTKADGEVTSDSGWYDPNDKSIHIDLRAGEDGEGTMLYTASHELVHFMKDNAREHYDALEKLVLDALEKSGVSIEKELERQRQSLIANGKKRTDADFEEVAREEMIADACMKFLASKNAVAEIKALKTKNRGLWNALKKFFTSLFNKLNKIYKTVDPDSATAKYIADIRNSVKPIRDAFMEGITAAGEKYTAERKALGEGANVKVDSNGEFVQGTTKDKKTILSNARTWEKGGRATLKATLESEGFSAEDVKAALTIMDEHMRLVTEFGKKYTAQDIANNAVLTTDVKTGESVLSAIISNGDYPVNIDLLTICKKREAYQQVINRLCESGMINQATLDSLAIAEINKILGKYGFETACLGCYVESRRIRIQEWADTIVKEWNGIVDKLEGKGKGKPLGAASETFVSDLSNEEISNLSAELDEAYERDGLKYGRATVVKKMEQLQREVPALRKYLSVSDLITPTGRANLKSWSQEVNSLINCRYGANTPKIIQKFNPYNSELAQYGIVPKAYKSLRDYLYAIGGARMQSFSDFIIENWFDYAQIVADLSARKLPMHTYTKELALVKLFGMTGIKINMSLIPDVDSSLGKEYAGLTKNSKGEYELIFADKDRYKATGGKSYMQSINFADAIALQNDPNYSANIGTIAIGISDKQIEMMLDDSRIRMVIPYHSSGMNPIFAHLVGIKNYNDYTNEQNTGVKRLVDANGKEKSVKLKKEQIASLTKGFQYNEALQRLGDARAAANEYKEWCRDTSKHTIEIDGKTYYAELTPKFEKFSAHENYYKLLADYNPYDCITEESKPQQDVTQTYPENFATMLEDELKARDIYSKKQDAKWDDAMAEINAYLETHTRADTVKYADEHGIKISAKDRKLAKQESAKKEIRSKARVVDTNGNELTEAQQEYFKDSTVRDSKGNLMVLYHGTTANFNEFKKGDVGFHFGTKGAARGRVGYGKNVTLKEVYLNIKNPIVFDDDLGSWDADYRITRELYDRGILTQAEAETVLLTDSKLYRRTTEAANKKLAEVLLAKGYDGIQYTNTHESKKDSTSYIIFDSNQAKLTSNTDPTSSKDIRHKARGVDKYTAYDKPITTSDVEVLRTIGRKSINDFTSDDIEKAQKWAYKFYQELGTKSPFFRAWFGDWREYDTVSQAKIIDTKSDKRTFIVNQDTKWKIQTSKKVHKETNHHSGSSEVNAVKYLPYIDDITENAVLFNSEISDKENQNSLMFHTMYAYTEVMGYPALLKLKVEEMFYYNVNESGELMRDYILQSVEEESVSKRSRLSRSNHSNTNSSTISVADLFNLVKTYDKDFKPKSANPLLLDENHQPKIFYHGTNAEFSVFDADKTSRTTKRYAEGFYFTEERRVAEKWSRYREKEKGGEATVMAVYLDVKNPLVMSDKDYKRLGFDDKHRDEVLQSLIENKNDGIIIHPATERIPGIFEDSYKYEIDASVYTNAEKYGITDKDYAWWLEHSVSNPDFTAMQVAVFNSEQVKSATDNIGTFDKGERNILHKARSTPSASIPYTSPTAKSIVTNIDSGYEYTKRDKIKTGYIAAQIAMTNAQAGIEARAKQYGVKDIESLVQAARVATNQAQEMIGGNQYRIGSDTKDYLGEGLQKIYKPIQEKGEEYERTFFDYLFHQHNADRMSLERRSIEWNEQKKEEMKNLAQRAKEIRNEEMKLTGEKTKWAYKRSEEARSERNRIDLKLKELSRELVSIGKARRKLQKEIDSFEALKNKPVIGLNHDEVEAKKAEISARITELVAEKRKLGTKKANEEKVKEINAEIEALKQERSELTAEVTEEKSREIIAEYEKNYPEFIETAQKIWKYSENLNLFRVDAGLIDQEQFDYLKKLYPHYVPTYRADTKTGIAAIKGKNNVAVSQSIRTATGSTKDLLNPIVIMARQTMETIRAGRVNMIAKALYEGAAAHNDTTYIKEISKKAVDKSKLVDLDPTELRPKSNQVTFFKDGQRITLQVSSDIFAGFDAFTPQVDATNPILQITHKANDIFKKLVTSWNPLFIVRNSIRDIQDAGINTKYGKTFVQNYIRAGNEIRTGGELWQLYKAMGGTNVNLFDFDKGFKGEQSKMGLEAGLMKKIANANAFVECLPRFAEFISSIEAGNTAEQAMLDAADVTTNFARTGTITKKLNSTIIPFLNPAIQGASKAIRNITSIRSFREALILITKAALVGVLPFVLNNLLLDDDEDYKDLKETDKENNYLIKVGDVFLKLPRGRMASVLAGATNRTINSIEGEEKAWKGYLKNASTQMNPIENMARTIFSPFMDVKNNVTWYGSAIEGREFENKSPSQRYDESTSSIAIALGKFLNYSPKKIHYILDQYSGVVGDFVLPATTKKAEKGFISGNFVIDPVTSNKLSEQFYDMYYDAQYAKSDDPNDKTAEYQVKHLNRIKSAISDLYDKKSEIQNSNMSNSEKLAETRAIQILINEMYKTALNDYELVTKAIEATSSVDDKYRYTEVQRLVYGAETALKDWDDTVYEKSTLLKRSGISYDNFYQYYFGIKDIESDKDKEGNTISGSKKAKVIEKIDSLKISEENKLLLIAYSGYSIDDAKEREKLLKYINGLKLSANEKKKLADILNFEYKNGTIVYE